jgi:hypothetical protein
VGASCRNLHCANISEVISDSLNVDEPLLIVSEEQVFLWLHSLLLLASSIRLLASAFSLSLLSSSVLLFFAFNALVFRAFLRLKTLLSLCSGVRLYHVPISSPTPQFFVIKMSDELGYRVIDYIATPWIRLHGTFRLRVADRATVRVQL